MPTQAERSERTRRRILDAALGLYAERGWAATPVDEVLRSTGVTKGALYHHFNDKVDLLRALYEEQEQRLVERLLATVASFQDPVEALRAGCRAFLAACLDPAFRQIALIDAPAALGWHEWREIDTRYGLGLLRTGVGAVANAGRLRLPPGGTIDRVAHLLLAALMEAALLLAHEPSPHAALDDIATTFEWLLDGLVEKS
jgi:AcrR family transcriptional regulator